MVITTEAIILISRKYSDSSKIVTVFTEDVGKISLLAKGAYRLKSKFGGSLESMNHVSVNLYYHPSRDLHLLHGVETLSSMTKISLDSTKLTLGLMACESIHITQHPNDSNPALFKHLLNFLTNLRNSNRECFYLFVRFLILLAEDMGFAPNFTTSHLRDKAAVAGISIREAAVLNHAPNSYEKLFMMDVATIQKLDNLQKCKTDCPYNFNEREKRQMIGFWEAYFSYHTERNFAFRSSDMLFSLGFFL